MHFYQRHEVLVSMLVFCAGFIVDVYTIRRIDNLRGLIQQAVYLLVLGAMLVFEIRKLSGLKIPKKIHEYWRYHNLLVHFLFGSLLSLYTIFYYTSASAITSFLFILLLAGLMFTNEFGKIRTVGLPVRSILYSMCTLSYFSFLYPIFMGRIGALPFWLGFSSSLGLISLIWVLNFRGVRQLKKQVLYPVILMHAFFLTGYYTSFLPPVPVAVKKIGVYYDIIKKDNKYTATHTRTLWETYRPGAKDFYVRAGDKVSIFVSIFSPARFQDRVYLRWYFNDSNHGWKLEDTIPIEIIGGRKEGFRGYGTKQFYKLGHWRILVETSDGREVGRITIEIKADSTVGDRTFKTDVF